MQVFQIDGGMDLGRLIWDFLTKSTTAIWLDVWVGCMGWMFELNVFAALTECFLNFGDHFIAVVTFGQFFQQTRDNIVG